MLSAAEYAATAEKYRAIAAGLPWNIPGPQNREYYLNQAAEYERLAAAAAAPIPTADVLKHHPQPVALKQHPPTIQLKTQARCHSQLAVAVLALKKADIHRAFAVWLSIDRSKRTWFSYSEMLQFVAEKWGSHHRNVRRWLAAGDGVFWSIGKAWGMKTIRFYGAYNVLRGFNLAVPGVVQFISTDALRGKLQALRSQLFGCTVTKDTGKWISRETLKTITGVEVRTQQNYHKLSGQKRLKTYAIGLKCDGGGNVKQMPNIYHRLHKRPYYSKNKLRLGLYTPEKNETSSPDGCSRVGSVKTSAKRLLFDTANKAIKAIDRYGEGATFSPVTSPYPNRNSKAIFLKVYTPAL